jgi:hypothetical protein
MESLTGTIDGIQSIYGWDHSARSGHRATCSSINTQGLQINNLILSCQCYTKLSQSTCPDCRLATSEPAAAIGTAALASIYRNVRAGKPILLQVSVNKGTKLTAAICSPTPTPYYAHFYASCEAAAAPSVWAAASMYRRLSILSLLGSF